MNPIQAIMYLKNKDSLDNLYKKAVEAQKEFLSFLIRSFPKNSSLVTRKGLKSLGRVCDKMMEGGSIDKIYDINGATYIFKNIESLLEAKDYFASLGNTVRIKDRISNPTDLGYRDILINVRMSNGFIGEILLIPDTIFSVKMGEGHKLYEKTRNFFVKFFFPKKVKLWENKQKELYQEAWISFLKN